MLDPAFIGFIGVVLGAGVTGYISYKSNKAQIQATHGNLQLQLDYQKSENRKQRIIEARKPYLLPLRKALSGYIQKNIIATNMLVRREISRKKNDNDPENSPLKLYEAMQAVGEAWQFFEQLRGQISDAVLEQRIQSLVKTEIKIDVQRMPLLRRLQDGGDISEPPKVAGQNKELMSQLQTCAMHVNQRIDELLSGDEAETVAQQLRPHN